MENAKIIIVDDHELYRLGERAVVEEKLPQTKILAEFGSGQDLLEYLESHPLPDIILLDIVMPKLNGTETARLLREKYPKIKIIMLSSEVSPETIGELLDIGVDGYLSKLAVTDDLTKAISAVLQGNSFFGQDISKTIGDLYISKQENTKQNQVLFTTKELEVVTLLCDGLLVKEIGDKLNMSKRTAERHKHNIMEKLGFQTTAELIKYAIKKKIIVL